MGMSAVGCSLRQERSLRLNCGGMMLRVMPNNISKELMRASYGHRGVGDNHETGNDKSTNWRIVISVLQVRPVRWNLVVTNEPLYSGPGYPLSLLG